MDCPSEEQLIRMKLGELNGIHKLEFDLPNRRLIVFHEGDHFSIFTSLASLNLGAQWVESEEAVIPNDPGDADQRTLLWQVLLINLFFFILELITGFLSNSMGLVADGLDMLADSLVYGLALFAVGSTVVRKRRVAKLGGYFQMVLAIGGLVEVVRRFLGFGEVPAFQTMIVISILALLGNIACLILLQRNKSSDAHMKASKIFTSNDVIANLGVIVAGSLVYATQSNVPDLMIGLVVFGLVGRGAVRILKL